MKSFLTQILLTSFLLVSGVALAGDDLRAGLPKYPTPVGEKCVEPTDVMRRVHMNFILQYTQHHRKIDGVKCIDKLFIFSQ